MHHCHHDHGHHAHDAHGHAAEDERLELGRHGARLEDGLGAHALDHAKWSRRDFLLRMGIASAGVGFMMNGVPMEAFGHAPVLHALNESSTDRILVLIQLNGGNDGLNTIVPYENDEYYRVRPTIAIPKASAIRLDDDHGMHPAMQSLARLWNDGDMAVVLNTGYRNSTRSHFAGTVNWTTGSGRMEAGSMSDFSTGVWGRYLAKEVDALKGTLTHPLAVRIGGPVSLFQSARGNLGVSLGDSQFIEQIAERGFYDADDDRVKGQPFGRPMLFVREVANASLKYVTSVQEAAQRGTNQVAYPNTGFSNNLAAAARLIRGGLGSNVISVSRGGFDTHSMQGGTDGRHAGMWRDISDAVAAFLNDLKQDGLDRRVMVMTFSEFGRTLEENGSRGTDHGAGASMMLFGSGLNGGVYGTQSDLVSQLYGGDPEPSTDFRTLYASLLQDWFGLPAGEVDALLGASFPRMSFVDSSFGVNTEPASVPIDFTLDQNYPNPFNPVTTIRYALRDGGPVNLTVYDMQGRAVRTLVDRTQTSGAHAVTFDASDLPSGTYLYRLDTPAGSATKSMTLLK